MRSYLRNRLTKGQKRLLYIAAKAKREGEGYTVLIDLLPVSFRLEGDYKRFIDLGPRTSGFTFDNSAITAS